MLLHTVYSIIRHRFGRVVRLACAMLLLVVADQTKSSADTLFPSGLVAILPASAFAGFPAADKDDGIGAGRGSGNRKSLNGKATFTNASSSHFGTGTAPFGETSSHITVAENRIPDWNGIWIDTGVLFGAQIVVTGLVYMMPESVSGWSAEQKKDSFKKYADNVFDPVIDKDKFYVNYIIHPYWGATYYTRARERGLDKAQSFVYSALISAMFEFGVECFFEKPSIQDLIVTPVAGSLLGAFLFEPWRESIKRKQDLQWYDHAVLIATDPVGVLSSGIEHLFGLTSTIRIDYYVPQLQKRSTESALASRSSSVGVVMQFPFN